MNPENRKRLEAAIDFLREQDAGCLGDGISIERGAQCRWSRRDELVDNLCRVLNGDPWRKIDPEDEETWPREWLYVNICVPLLNNAKCVFPVSWRGHIYGKQVAHWKPWDAPEPPKEAT